MRNVQKAVVLSLCVLLTAQEETKTKKRKIYRTQSGSIIEAARPLFERSIKESEPKLEQKKTSTALARTKVVETTYKNELDSLKSQVKLLLKQSSELQKNYEEALSGKMRDTIFVYTTLYDTTTSLDTTFIYTNATNTVYDTVVIIDSIYINNYDTMTVIQTNYDTTYVLDTTVIVNYDTTISKDTVWAFAYDTTYLFDTTWVFAHDTTV